MATELDQHDHRILAELQADARLTMAELGRRVHLSQPAVTERVRKLEDGGVIRGYRAVVDASKLGYGIRSIIRIGNLDEGELMRALECSPEVTTAYGVTGEDSWILEIAVRDVAHLRATLSRFCQQVPTSTAIILNAVREHAPIKPLPTTAEPEPTPVLVAAAKKKPRQSRA
ncbi:ArsR family transcriptional regulator [Pelomonas sp. Root1217]|uniref:Lrp/AsnC family transcriptional regulator n=1 Tax=Pelomonas sp. Root1217 TaxID=1736430 RepID=UPI00070A4B70|nr:Lrp/AsnC family transcriptional regulator [Pelomonas sp. Root1217]KQV49187.1 ArsR family transcriptional regulator [Pelomonas sp. Root1217]